MASEPRRSMKKVLDDARAMEARLIVSEQPISPEVIEVGAEIIARHRTSLQPGPLDREIAETVIRAVGEKHGLRADCRHSGADGVICELAQGHERLHLQRLARGYVEWER